MRASIMRSARNTRLTVRPVIEVALSGQALLDNPLLNKGAAFPEHERRSFKLNGLLPPFVSTLEDQVDRAYSQFSMYPTDLLKNSYCESLKVQNIVLYYALIKKHLVEMMRIIYTPTEGEAIEQYSHLFRRPEGCFLDIDHPDSIEDRLDKFGDDEDIDYIVVSDSEAILGIGDQGVGGIGISVAKLALMTACGGIHPARVIPVVLDTGTNNQKLLDDPLYMGSRQKRVRGAKYDEFVDKFVQTVRRKFPGAVLHFEDFGLVNAARLLEKYRNQLACFNDDIQGTGAVTMSALKSALHSSGKHLEDAKILIFGAGTAGIGIADQCVDNLEHNGVEVAKARKNVTLFDKVGLITKDKESELTDGQKLYAVDPSEWKDVDTNSLLEVVKRLKPDVLIGTSTKPKSFTKEIVQEMSKHVDRPIIFPLSNPTRLHEAVPADLIEWTDGKVLVATGSPFDPVDGREISENNNFFIFPGIGLGAVLARAKVISKGMIAAAVDQLASLAPALDDPNGALLPHIKDINDISARIASSVIAQAKKEGVTDVEKQFDPLTGLPVEIPESWDEIYEWTKSQMWQPEYINYRRTIGTRS